MKAYYLDAWFSDAGHACMADAEGEPGLTLDEYFVKRVDHYAVIAAAEGERAALKIKLEVARRERDELKVEIGAVVDAFNTPDMVDDGVRFLEVGRVRSILEGAR